MFGEKLQNLRKEKGIFQEELSEVLDVSRQSISKNENGSSQPSFEKLVLISKFFNVSIDALLV
ncbi:helix-turn-helix domain-containing protein [Vagococcus sp.]|uniref:helix-turn-helix domain-containing protein n=1 Tax=Vagococcus sp. TaxID=1933889 RepID=UPI002FC8303B